MKKCPEHFFLKAGDKTERFPCAFEKGHQGSHCYGGQRDGLNFSITWRRNKEYKPLKKEHAATLESKD